MGRFALQPASLASKSVAEHYANTIVKPVVFDDHTDLLEPDVLEQLNRQFPSGRARMWGVVPGRANTSKYLSLNPGDGVALYGQGELYAAGRIAVLFNNAELALRLWGADDHERTWEQMYAMADFHDVQVPIQLVQQIMGWSSKAVVQGFTVAEDERAEDLAALCQLDLNVTLAPEGAPPPIFNPAEHAEWLADNPSDADALKRRSLARVLASRMKRVHADSPEESFFLHIDGPWGAGKSTLLSLLKQEFQGDFVVVEFDAWRNIRVDPPWWALLTTLRAHVRDALPWWRRRFLRLQEAAARIRRVGAPYFLGLLFLTPIVIGVAAAVYWGFDTYFKKFTDLGKAGEVATKWVQLTAATIGLLGTLVAGAMVLSRFLLWDSARGAKLFEQAKADPMHEVAMHFAWLLKRSPKHIVFFIDDLDRCDEKYVVTLLEAAQTLIRATPLDRQGRREAISVVVAADGAWLRQAFEVSYERFKTAVEEPGRPLGYLFLDKLFQLRVPLPSIGSTSQSAFFRGLLGRTEPEENDVAAEAGELLLQVNASNSETDILQALRGASQAARELVAAEAVTKMSERRLTADVEHALERFSPLLNANPRSMKRYINCYTVVRAARTLEGNPVETDVLAMWVLIQTRWPLLADYLQQQPDVIDYIGQESLPDDLPETLHALMRSATLTNVLKAAPTPLTPDLVRMSCGALVERPDITE
jgi:hypothetical protein